MLGPRRGPSVCTTCFNFTDGYSRCYACDHGQSVLDAVAPISYSVAREQLHHALASYKRLDGDVARRLGASLAAILWRFLAEHERCVARAAGTDRFDLVTTVPSGDRARDTSSPFAGSSGARRTNPRPSRAPAAALTQRRRPASVQPRQVRGDPTDPRRYLRAADRRHVDDGGERPERRRGAQGRGRRRNSRGRHRPPPQSRMARERPAPARHRAPVRLEPVRPVRGAESAATV